MEKINEKSDRHFICHTSWRFVFGNPLSCFQLHYQKFQRLGHIFDHLKIFNGKAMRGQRCKGQCFEIVARDFAVDQCHRFIFWTNHQLFMSFRKVYLKMYTSHQIQTVYFMHSIQWSGLFTCKVWSLNSMTIASLVWNHVYKYGEDRARSNGVSASKRPARFSSCFNLRNFANSSFTSDSIDPSMTWNWSCSGFEIKYLHRNGKKNKSKWIDWNVRCAKIAISRTLCPEFAWVAAHDGTAYR